MNRENAPANFIADNLLSMATFYACSGPIIASITEYYEIPLAVSNFLTGLMGMLPVLQIIGGMRYMRSRHPKRFLLSTNIIWRALFPLIFLSVLMPLQIGGAVMVFSYVATVALIQYVGAAQMDWLVGCVEGKVQDNYYSIRDTALMIGLTVLSIVANLSMDWAKRTQQNKTGFIVIGIMCVVFLSISVIYLLRLPKPQHTVRKEERVSLLTPFSNRRYLRVVASISVWVLATVFIGGFAAVYQIRVLHISFLELTIWTTVGNIVRAVCTPLAARAARVIGWKRINEISALIAALGAFLWMMADKENLLLLYPLICITCSVPFAGLGPGFLKVQVATIPETGRSIYFSVTALCNGMVSIIGSLLCSAMIGVLEVQAPHLMRYIFAIGGTLAAVSAWMMLKVPAEK